MASHSKTYDPLIPAYKTKLAFYTRDYIQRHGGKALKKKKAMAEGWMLEVEEMIFERGLAGYDVWASV